jgi:hypothetical protein
LKFVDASFVGSLHRAQGEMDRWTMSHELGAQLMGNGRKLRDEGGLRGGCGDHIANALPRVIRLLRSWDLAVGSERRNSFVRHRCCSVRQRPAGALSHCLTGDGMGQRRRDQGSLTSTSAVVAPRERCGGGSPDPTERPSRRGRDGQRGDHAGPRAEPA